MFENLVDVFSAAATKYLTAVDAEPKRSNQHEIGGLPSAGIGDRLGYPLNGEKTYLPARMIYFDEFESDPVTCEDTVTWYDARFDNPLRAPEYRLYYRSNAVSELFQEGDFFLIALTRTNSLLMIFCRPGGTVEAQLRQIFGAVGVRASKTLRQIPIEESAIQAPIRLILSNYGIEVDLEEDNEQELALILRKFNNEFPQTRKFSNFARSRCRGISAVEDPDTALISWMEKEEHLFRLLERHIVRVKLQMGFGEHGDDVDEFVSFSLSVQNRRKSRVGHAFENHIEEVLRQNGLQFERGANTEGKQKPDFLFPSSAAYSDPLFAGENLRILAAKTTCKDRWRQVLPEANRVFRKHLITLEHSISNDQTNQMRSHNIQLIVPVPFQGSYLPEQKAWLYSLSDFIQEVKGIAM
jgi:hypothetical protein